MDRSVNKSVNRSRSTTTKATACPRPAPPPHCLFLKLHSLWIASGLQGLAQLCGGIKWLGRVGLRIGCVRGDSACKLCSLRSPRTSPKEYAVP